MIVFFLFSLFFSVSAESLDVFLNKASSEFVYEKKEKEKISFQKAFLSLTAQQVTGFIESRDFITNFFVNFNYPFQESFSLSITQGLNRNYYIKTDPIDKTGLWIRDTVLSLNKVRKFTNSQLSFQFSSSLPVSYYSRLNKVFTLSSLTLNASLNLLSFFEIKEFFGIKEISLFMQPAFNYYFSPPTTPIQRRNREGEIVIQTSGGNLLPQSLFGIRSMGFAFKLSDKFSLSHSVGRWAIKPYRLKRNTENLYDKAYYRHYYSLVLSAKYQVFKPLTLQLAYSHVDRLDKAGQIQKILLFDDQVSSWLISASYRFNQNPFIKKETSYDK